MKRLLTREAILAAQDVKTQDVEVPEWGGDVRIRSFTAAQRDDFMAAVIKEDGKIESRAYRTKLLARCMTGDDGTPLLSEEELGTRNPVIVDRLFAIADRLNAAGEAQVKVAVKNSKRGTTDASSSGGP